MARKKKRGSLVGVLDEEAKLSLTPMIDISFLILIFFMCLPFKTLEGKLAAFLPTDKGIAPTEEEPPQVIQIKVHILARKEVLIPNWGVAKHGGQQIFHRRPANFQMPSPIPKMDDNRRHCRAEKPQHPAAAETEAQQSGKESLFGGKRCKKH